MEECPVEMGNQQELLGRLHSTGFYDSSVLLEAMGKIAELGDKINKIHGQLKGLTDSTEHK